MQNIKVSNVYFDESLFVNIIRTFTIMLVVSGHMGGIFNLIGIPYYKEEIFPAYSFHMSAFIFFSGYFFKLNNLIKIKYFLKNKLNKLIIPYFVANIFYSILTYFLKSMNLFSNCKELSLFNLFIEPWLSGYQFNLNGPSWFVLFLFLIQFSYFLIKKWIYKNEREVNKKLEYFLLIVFVLIGFFGTYLSTIDFIKNNSLCWMIVRVLFGIQFYHMGYIYKNFLIEKIPLNLKSFLLLIFMKLIFIKVLGNYTFSMRTLLFKNEIFLPIIVSILGIYYISHISYFIVNLIIRFKLEKIKQVFNTIGQNTWSIMMHHMLINLIYDNTLRKFSLPVLNYMLLPVLALVIPILWSLFYKKNVSRLTYFHSTDKINHVLD